MTPKSKTTAQKRSFKKISQKKRLKNRFNKKTVLQKTSQTKRFSTERGKNKLTLPESFRLAKIYHLLHKYQFSKNFTLTPLSKIFSIFNRKKPAPSKVSRHHLKILFLASIISTFTFTYFYILQDLPSPEKLTSSSYPASSLIFDRHGQLLYEIFTDQNRQPIQLDRLPDYVKQATISIEDKDFYSHHGLSPAGITRAILKNIQYAICQLSIVSCPTSFQGGSTITQQLVKNALLTSKRTLQRKIKEAILTIAVETSYSKDQILEMYLNHIAYGGTSYGIESASQTYFGKSATELTLAEATILAGLPAAPTRYSPFGINPEAYKQRQKAVIRRMVEDNYITQEQANEVLQTEIKFSTQANLIHAPHFVLWVKDLLVQKYGQHAIDQGGLRVTTTLDLELQQFAQKTVTEEVGKLKSYKTTNGAALITNPATGQILAMVGSADYFNPNIDGNVNLTLRHRQPGSSIKPLNYALGFSTGQLTPSSLLADIPTCFSVTGQSLYCPVNYDGQYHGAVQVRTALSNSYNIPAVRIIAKNGLQSFIDTATSMGITGWEDPSKYGLSITLGGGEVRMVDLVTAYGTMANLGQRVNLVPILKVENSKREVLEEWQCSPGVGAGSPRPQAMKSVPTESEKTSPLQTDFCNSTPAISPESAYLVTNILSDSAARSPTFGDNLNISHHPEVAVKTGTTNDLRDNWTIGYNPNFLVATWVGNFDNTPMSRIASGITGAAPIWRTIMSYTLNEYSLLKDKTNSNEFSNIYPLDLSSSQWPKPSGIVDLAICVESGLAVSPDQNSPCTPRQEMFIKDYIPQHHTSAKRPWPIDKTTGQPAIDRTPLENIEMQDKTIYFDILGTAICADCAQPVDPVIIKYPLTE